MNDFFGALVERVLPSTPAVLPRRPVHFESPTAAPIEVPTRNSEVQDFIRLEKSPAFAATEPVPPAKPSPPSLPVVVQKETSRPQVRDEPQVPRTPMRVETGAPGATSEKRITPTVAAPIVVVPRVADVNKVPAQIETQRQDKAQKPIRRADRPAEREPHPQAILPRRELLITSPIVPVVQRAPFPPKSATDPTAERERAERPYPPAPRIEITIGTVEVRALVAPSAPPPIVRAPREPTPPVSLTDYLRQRGNART